MGDSMWVVIVIHANVIVGTYGPFATRDDASAWEDASLNAPAGSRATFVEVTAPTSA